MGNNAVKTIVLVMVLVVLSLVIGAQISDSVRDSFGAFGTIGAIVGAFFMLWLGKKSWQLIFLVPPVLGQILSLLHMPLPLPLAPPIACVIGLYWALMRVMGYVRFSWRTLPVLDVYVFAIVIYMAASFYQHPVAIQAFGMEGDMVGGKDYLIGALAVAYYVIISAMPWRLESLLKCLKWAFIIGVVLSLISSVFNMLNPGATDTAIGDDGANAADILERGRFSFFVEPGMKVLVYVFFSYSIWQIATSARKSAALLFGILSVLVSGWRTRLVIMLIDLGFIACLKRELTVVAMLVIPIYIGILGLGSVGALDDAPYGMQRVLTAVPGIKVSAEASKDATGSSDIRKRMWENALNPRTGLIRDYVWGDGFQSSLAEIKRDETARMRSMFLDQQQYMERHGSWHNGWITVIHRLGIVGLVLLQGFMLVSVLYLFRLGLALRHVPNGAFGFMTVFSFLPYAFTGAFLVLTVDSYLNSIIAVANMKVLYCLLMERGLLTPMLSRQPYVPMTIRELEQSA